VAAAQGWRGDGARVWRGIRRGEGAGGGGARRGGGGPEHSRSFRARRRRGKRRLGLLTKRYGPGGGLGQKRERGRWAGRGGKGRRARDGLLG
jgi:hypothetical protein